MPSTSVPSATLAATDHTATVAAGRRPAAVLLWTVQIVLAALFLYAGGTKLVMPIAALTQQSPMPGAIIRLVGVLEVLGALGLILPGALRIRPGLTPLAAAALAVLMVGATGATLAGPQAASAPIPVAVGVVALALAYGRRSWALPGA